MSETVSCQPVNHSLSLPQPGCWKLYLTLSSPSSSSSSSSLSSSSSPPHLIHSRPSPSRGYRSAGVIEVGGAFTMRRGSACSGCIFQRANRCRLLFSPSKLLVHTDKQGERGDVGRRRGVSDKRVISSFLFSSLPRLSLLSSLDSLLGLRVKHRRGRERWKE